MGFETTHRLKIVHLASLACRRKTNHIASYEGYCLDLDKYDTGLILLDICKSLESEYQGIGHGISTTFNSGGFWIHG